MGRPLIILLFMSAVLASTGCVIVVEDSGEVDAGWASNYAQHSREVSDANRELARSVSATLARDAILTDSDITVSARGDTVTLHGRVQSVDHLDRAVDLAVTSPGVGTVVSRMTVEVLADSAS